MVVLPTPPLPEIASFMDMHGGRRAQSLRPSSGATPSAGSWSDESLSELSMVCLSLDIRWGLDSSASGRGCTCSGPPSPGLQPRRPGSAPRKGGSDPDLIVLGPCSGLDCISIGDTGGSSGACVEQAAETF